MNVKLSRLLGVAAVGGMAVGAMALVVQVEKNKAVNMPICIKYAIETMNKTPKAMELLGEPYTIERPSVDYEELKDGSSHVVAKIPIHGTNDIASLHALANRVHPKGKYKLYRLEMTFEKIKGQKMILLDIEKEKPVIDTRPKTKKPDYTQMKKSVPSQP